MEFRDDRSIAVGASTGNILVGNPFEFAPQRPTAVMVYACADPPTVAGDSGGILLDFLLGTSIVVQASPIPHFTQYQGPTRDQHLVASGIAAPGSRIVVSYRSIAANAIRARTLITFRPV